MRTVQYYDPRLQATVTHVSDGVYYSGFLTQAVKNYAAACKLSILKDAYLEQGLDLHGNIRGL